jgi:hypothetical protein
VTLDFGGGQVLSTTANVPVVRQFAQAGTFTIQASHQVSGQSIPDQGTLTVIVQSADFGPAFPVYSRRARTWSVPGLPAGVAIQPDPAIYVLEQTPVSGVRTFSVEALDTFNHKVLARLSEGGPVLAQGTVSSLNVASTDTSQDTRVVYTYENGDRLVRMGVVVDNLPPGGYVRLDIFVAGVTFSDGTTSKKLYAADFDANGVAYVLFNYPAAQPTSVCHQLYVYDAQNQLVGQR